MEKKLPLPHVATAFAVTLAAAPLAQAADNPFALVEYRGGMQVAENQGEMKCGASMDMGHADAAKGEAKAEAGKQVEAAADKAAPAGTPPVQNTGK